MGSDVSVDAEALPEQPVSAAAVQHTSKRQPAGQLPPPARPSDGCAD